MTTTSRSEASFSRLLLSWVSYRVSLAMASIRPVHRAGEIAAVAAASNNPAGA
ncbi:hypothetical protein JQ617_08650 [Bradyrhizobium sp. KB893862 SZCCT0404]|uniref:hypothetical protein n=1 Tax=Bradyrhizobium sp. KB893862 SZCCT0404 TaxID=2807672 RepID=UPI001BA7A1F6|nr:hypothetical protein [Bradyrhizobium sp. KB893862 SZCCT0404]MBR1174019.1 hypothetical protein [Bradyrhizobium sp. KB893862 SZCCT0404]